MKVEYIGNGFKNKQEIAQILKRIAKEVEQENLEALSGVAETGKEIYHSFKISRE